MLLAIIGGFVGMEIACSTPSGSNYDPDTQAFAALFDGGIPGFVIGAALGAIIEFLRPKA